MHRVGGLIELKINGTIERAKGSFSYGLGTPERTAVSGPEGLHGYIEKPAVAYIEGEITDRPDLDVKQLFNITNGQIMLRLPNGKGVSLLRAYYAGQASVSTEEGAIGVRFEAAFGQETT